MNQLELHEFIAIFTSRARLIGVLLILSLLTGWGAYRLQKQCYTGEVLLSVTRTTTETTQDYRYDQFYRLQADERMADTIVQYLSSEAGKEGVARRIGAEDWKELAFLKGNFQAVRLSSQLIRVRYTAETPTEATRLAAAIGEVGEQYTESLNEQAKDKNWFALVTSDPVIKDGRFTPLVALLAGLLTGLFIAFWTVLGLHYWYGPKK